MIIVARAYGIERAPRSPRRRRRRAAACSGDELAGRAVVLDDRLRLLVVDREPLRSPRGVSSSRPSSGARSCIRSSATSSGRSKKRIRVEAAADPGQHRVERLGLGEVARKAVEDEAVDGVVLREPLADHRDRDLVGNELAARHDRLDARPSSVESSRRAEHVAGRDVRDSLLAAIRFAWVPFPDPWRPEHRSGGPLLEEALVGAHHHLRLHLAHRVERDADRDQHGGAAERAGRRLREAAVADEERRQRRDEREVDRAGQRQPRQDAVEVLRGRRARAGCPGCSRRSGAGCRPGRPG